MDGHKIRGAWVDEAQALTNARIICGVTHPLIDGGRPCTKGPEHEAGQTQLIHVTDNGFWWSEQVEEVVSENELQG